MSILNIFTQDAFSVMRLTDALREIKYTPSRIGQMGLFQTTSIDTLDIAIEKDKEQNRMLVSASPRGGPGQTFDKNKRAMRMLKVPHFQVDDAIYADEVQQVRAFGQEQAVERLQQKIADRAAEASQFFALTEEYHRLNILKTGQLLDADGTVLFDYFTEFGESQQAVVDFDLDNATPGSGVLRKRCQALIESVEDTLGGLAAGAVQLRAECGSAFFADLVAHKEVRETYLNTAAAADLRGRVGEEVSFGGITFRRYRGGLGFGVPTDKAYFYPEGVEGLFEIYYAPADTFETVNTVGLPLYARMIPDRDRDEWVRLEIESNPLPICTRPQVLRSARRT